jgi:glycosyltransferase involved in cell wall biosynthesis
MQEPVTILSIFSGDLWAGAEVMIHNLLAQLRDSSRLRPVALSLNEGSLTECLRRLPIETHVIAESRCSFPHIVFAAGRRFHGQHIDVIHSHRYKENLLAYLLSLILRPKLLLTTVHGLSEPSEARPLRSDRMSRLNYALLRRRFSRVVAVSHDIKRRLIRDFGFTSDQVHVIHNGLHLPEAQSSPPLETTAPQRTLHIGTVGRLVPVKDFELFLTSAARIRERFRNVRFSILGDGPLRDDLSRQSSRVDMAGHVQLLPPLADPLPYYRSLDIYMNTSRHEGIPMSVLEAMACGIPIVAPDVGGIPEILSHGREGLLVGGREPGDFAEACLRLLEDPAMCRTLGRNGRETVAERFSASAMATQYLDLYCSHSAAGPDR